VRIVSLCPSITESLAALGLVESLAGVTRVGGCRAA
jgi:ABC-type hemin transport system substrate-binding protein